MSESIEITAMKAAVKGVKEDLMHLASLVRVLGFSAEARRVLTDIEAMADLDDEFAEPLNRLVDARLEWMHHEDTLGITLRDVASQIDKLHSRLEALS
jgi:hypothetical protein